MVLSEIYNLIFISIFLCNKDCSRIPQNPEYVRATRPEGKYPCRLLMSSREGNSQIQLPVICKNVRKKFNTWAR